MQGAATSTRDTDSGNMSSPRPPGWTLLPATRQALFAGAIRPERSERLSVTQLRQRLLRGTWEGLSGRRLVSLSSRVWTEKGALRHLVMMDFGIPASGARSKEAVAAAQEVLGLHGLLVLSGNSYHLYGDRLVEWPDLVVKSSPGVACSVRSSTPDGWPTRSSMAERHFACPQVLSDRRYLRYPRVQSSRNAG